MTEQQGASEVAETAKTAPLPAQPGDLEQTGTPTGGGFAERLARHRAAIAVGLASVIVGGLGGFALGHATADEGGRGAGGWGGRMGPGGGFSRQGQMPPGQLPQGQMPQGQVPPNQQDQQDQSPPSSQDGATDSSSLRSS